MPNLKGKLFGSLDLILRAKIDDFRELPNVNIVETNFGPLIHIDRGSNVLGVAHLDFVSWRIPKYRKTVVRQCPQLDDRLGVWVLLDLLPSMDVNTDILLTDSEECGESTAQFFDSPKKYNWMYQFDRAGTDVVMYEYETAPHCERLADHGFEVGKGSWSDISQLTSLGITGFNFGVGYHQQHTRNCHADLNDTMSQARKFRSFYNQYSGTKFEYTAPVYTAPAHLPYDYKDRYVDYKPASTGLVDPEWECEHCGEDLLWHRNGFFCVNCDYAELRNLIETARIQS